MATRRDDDYLICRHYYDNIKNTSSEYKDFITFKHNKNHYFAWVHNGKVILRSEAYPSADKMERGIKAIIKNRDIHERYSIDSQHGVHFLQLWGGGNHQKHTGNFDKHNEIGRSCPAKTKEELYALMNFRGKDFINGVFGQYMGGSASQKGAAAMAMGAGAIASTKGKAAKGSKKVVAGTKKAAGAASASYASASSTVQNASTGGGFKWWWLLPLLLIPIFFMWKGCGGDNAATNKAVKTEISAQSKIDKEAAAALEMKNKAKAEADAKMKAEAATKLAAEEAEAKKASEKKANAKGGSSNNRNRSSKSSASYIGNKNSGY